MNTNDAYPNSHNLGEERHPYKGVSAPEKREKKTAGYIVLFIINILIILTSPIFLIIAEWLHTSRNKTERLLGGILLISTIILTIAQVINVAKSYNNYNKNPERSLLRMFIPLVFLFLVFILIGLVSG